MRDATEADPAILVASFLLGGLSSVINLALGNALVPIFKSPPFTLAFNITMLLLLLASAHFVCRTGIRRTTAVCLPCVDLTPQPCTRCVSQRP